MVNPFPNNRLIHKDRRQDHAIPPQCRTGYSAIKIVGPRSSAPPPNASRPGAGSPFLQAYRAAAHEPSLPFLCLWLPFKKRGCPTPGAVQHVLHLPRRRVRAGHGVAPLRPRVPRRLSAGVAAHGFQKLPTLPSDGRRHYRPSHGRRISRSGGCGGERGGRGGCGEAHRPRGWRNVAFGDCGGGGACGGGCGGEFFARAKGASALADGPPRLERFERRHPPEFRQDPRHNGGAGATAGRARGVESRPRAAAEAGPEASKTHSSCDDHFGIGDCGVGVFGGDGKTAACAREH